MEKARQRPVRPQMNEQPLQGEMQKAISKMRRRKIAGSSGFLQPNETDLFGCFTEVLRCDYKRKCIPRDWLSATYIGFHPK